MFHTPGWIKLANALEVNWGPLFDQSRFGEWSHKMAMDLVAVANFCLAINKNEKLLLTM
jgi:hypothetical protein